MVKTKAQEIMYAISEVLYRNGKYGMERIAIICEIISKLMHSIGWDNNLNFDRKHFDNIINKLIYELNISSFLQNIDKNQFMDLFIYLIKEDKQDIANAIKQLVENDKRSSNIIPTDDFSVKIMQAFAKKMHKGGTYIDPCVGTGRLLAGLNADKYYGFDVDRNAIKIADTYLNLIENNTNRTRLSIKLSTENFLYTNMKFNFDFILPTFIYDPPLNEILEINDEKLRYELQNRANLSYNKNTIPSEYLFLSKILLENNDKDLSYITTFLPSFTNAEDKFRQAYRKFLVEDSLIAIIQLNNSTGSNINKLILVGNTKTILNHPIYLITPKDSDIPDDILDNIAQRCVSGDRIEDNEFYKYTKIIQTSRNELEKNGYIINMPQYYDNEIDPNSIKSLDEIAVEIRNSQKRLYDTNQKLDRLINNLNNGISQSFDINNDNVKASDKVPTPWFQEEDNDIANALKQFVSIEQNWKEWGEECYISEITNYLKNIKILFKDNRLRVKNNKFEIYSLKEKSEYKNDKSLSEYVFQANQDDPYISSLLESLSKKQIKIYNAFIEQHYNDNNKNYFSEFTTSEIHSTIGTLKVLGLLYTLPNVDDSLEKYFPYTNLLKVEEDNDETNIRNLH